MLKFAFNLVDDGLVGQQLFAGEATRLAYRTDEAAEGNDAFLEKRDPTARPIPGRTDPRTRMAIARRLQTLAVPSGEPPSVDPPVPCGRDRRGNLSAAATLRPRSSQRRDCSRTTLG